MYFNMKSSKRLTQCPQYSLDIGLQKLFKARSASKLQTSQNDLSNSVNLLILELINNLTCIVLRSYIWLYKALEPAGQMVKTASIASRPSYVEVPIQPVVQQSTACPSASRALQSQKWLRKIDARNCVDIFSY